MLSDFFLHRSRMVKSLNFEPNVWSIWKFPDFAKFNPSHVVKLSISSQIFNATENFLILPNFPRGGGGHSHYGGDADVRLQRLPIFSAGVTQWPIFLLIVSAVTKRLHIFLVKCGLFDHSHPKTPILCIRLPQEATFCFNFIDKLIIFAIFNVFFFKFLLLKRSLKDQK